MTIMYDKRYLLAEAGDQRAPDRSCVYAEHPAQATIDLLDSEDFAILHVAYARFKYEYQAYGLVADLAEATWRKRMRIRCERKANVILEFYPNIGEIR